SRAIDIGIDHQNLLKPKCLSRIERAPRGRRTVVQSVARSGAGGNTCVAIRAEAVIALLVLAARARLPLQARRGAGLDCARAGTPGLAGLADDGGTVVGCRPVAIRRCLARRSVINAAVVRRNAARPRSGDSAG